MNGYSTLTQKGQVAIPKLIRDFFKLKPSDKIYFEIKDNSIVAHRVSSVEEMRGIVKVDKAFTKKESKKIIAKATIEKFKKKSTREKKISS